MPDRRQLRLLLIEILVPFLLLAGAEVGVRIFVHHGAELVLPRFFPFPITTGKYLAYQELAKRAEPVDVLLLGMSQMLRANAARLGERLTESRHQRLRAFNFAAPLQTVDFNERLLSKVLLEIEKPRVIVFGVTPINLLHDERTAQTESSVQVSPVFMAYDGTVSGRMYGWLLDHVYLVRYREALRDRLQWTPMPTNQEWLQMARSTDALGDIPFAASGVAVSTLTPWEENYQLDFKQYDALMKTSLLFDRIEALARFCTGQGIGFLLVNNPVHPLFLTLLPHGRLDYDRFVFRLRNVATNANVPLCDPADGGTGPADLYQDTHHHNVPGSVWLTDALAACLAESQLLTRARP